ncbi:hypothetical protein [Leptospira interrogans]|uniref:hypothetical protein n=1 Tax=Leptospira interrogans TaxID=173 RepID=UPI0002D67854|nr:hypothetical protein [Leptospira interrogans]
MAFFISRKKLQNIRPTNNGFTISQRKARQVCLAFCVFGGEEREFLRAVEDSY